MVSAAQFTYIEIIDFSTGVRLFYYDVQRRLYSFALERKTPSIIMLRILFSRNLEENRLSSKISHKKLR